MIKSLTVVFKELRNKTSGVELEAVSCEEQKPDQLEGFPRSRDGSRRHLEGSQHEVKKQLCYV